MGQKPDPNTYKKEGDANFRPFNPYKSLPKDQRNQLKTVSATLMKNQLRQMVEKSATTLKNFFTGFLTIN